MLAIFTSVSKKVFVGLIIIWFVLSIFSIVYNSYKTVREQREWGHLSDRDKRNKLFGDLYNFLLMINKNTEKNTKILILSPDVKTHYLSIYYLYPRHIIDTSNIQNVQKMLSQENPLYIATYEYTLSIPTYVEIASYSSKLSSGYGVLYKRN